MSDRSSAGSDGAESETMDVSAPSGAWHDAPADEPGASRYVTIEELGRGGMGRVRRAYDSKLQREVALKEVRRDRLDPEATAGLVTEARAMAKLSHPNVVAVYDVEEVEAGEVIIAMEYVAGTTLKRWLGDEERSWRDIIECFLHAGRGLQAAHGAGLLHRDFKPANVLVSTDGTVKVTDFGVAKLSTSTQAVSSHDGDSASEGGTSRPLGSGVMGTPRYMAPEQHRGEALTVAADQYAFCVALWEALTGTPPFAGKAMAQAKAKGPPPWPEATTPRRIAAAIVRGLSPKVQDRWRSMDALLEALAWDPVRSRNRALLGVAGIGLLSAGAVAYQAWADTRTNSCSGAADKLAGVWDETRRDDVRSAFAAVGKTYATAAWTRTEHALDTYANDWAAMHTEVCEATTLRGEQSPELMDLRMGCLHRAVVDLDAAVGVLAEADVEVVRNAHRVTGSLRPLTRCADTEALTAAIEPPSQREVDAVESARVQLARARSLTIAGHYDEAERALEACKGTLAEVEYGPVRTEVTLLEGSLLTRQGRYEAARAALDETMRLASRWNQRDLMQEAASDWMYVVGFGQQHPEHALSMRPMAEGLSQDDPEAEGDFRNNLATVLQALGNYKEAEAEFRSAVKLWEAALGPDDTNVASARNNLGGILQTQGKYEEAALEHRIALEAREAALGPEHPDVAISRGNLANVLAAQGESSAAEAEYRAAIEIFENSVGPDHPHVALTRNNLGALLEGQGKYDEAEAEFRAAIASQEATLGRDHPEVAALRGNLGHLFQMQEKYSEAETQYRASIASFEKALGPDHPDVATGRSNFAIVLFEQGRNAQALPLAEKAWTRHQRDDIRAEQRATTAFGLARVLWAVDGPDRDRPRARQLAQAARDAYDEADGYEDMVAKVDQWLAAHRLR